MLMLQRKSTTNHFAISMSGCQVLNRLTSFFFRWKPNNNISEPSQAQERRVIVPMAVRVMIKLRKMGRQVTAERYLELDKSEVVANFQV